ncbi:MAG: DUF3892 domain-containing protein [Chloroflexi bacterium]|nr:DUF3892 domain-containing protein [Chloroflexota bacterium]
MEKWADYCISKVRYNSERTHIVKVEVREDKGDSLGTASEWTRSQVVSAIDRGSTFATILLDANNKWRKGQDVHTVTVNGVKYIRTDRNNKESDNLGNLPEF